MERDVGYREFNTPSLVSFLFEEMAEFYQEEEEGTKGALLCPIKNCFSLFIGESLFAFDHTTAYPIVYDGSLFV
jgi:hypothetical protein